MCAALRRVLLNGGAAGGGFSISPITCTNCRFRQFAGRGGCAGSHEGRRGWFYSYAPHRLPGPLHQRVVPVRAMGVEVHSELPPHSSRGLACSPAGRLGTSQEQRALCSRQMREVMVTGLRGTSPAADRSRNVLTGS